MKLFYVFLTSFFLIVLFAVPSFSEEKGVVADIYKGSFFDIGYHASLEVYKTRFTLSLTPIIESKTKVILVLGEILDKNRTVISCSLLTTDLESFSIRKRKGRWISSNNLSKDAVYKEIRFALEITPQIYQEITSSDSRSFHIECRQLPLSEKIIDMLR